MKKNKLFYYINNIFSPFDIIDTKCILKMVHANVINVVRRKALLIFHLVRAHLPQVVNVTKDPEDAEDIEVIEVQPVHEV